MPNLPDFLYVALFAVVLPLWDYLVWWPAFRRRLDADPVQARRRLWRMAIAGSWPLVAVGAALWIWNGRSFDTLGFSTPEGWRLWTAIGLVLLQTAYFALTLASLAQNAEARKGLQEQFRTLAPVLPHTRAEMSWWAGVSLSAGFCEEFLYRGYFVWVFAPWLGWWGAAALSLPFFAIPHVYQGWGGVLRTAIFGALYTLAVAIFGSLWPAIALHALFDLGQGMIAWLVLRDVPEAGVVVAGAQ